MRWGIEVKKFAEEVKTPENVHEKVLLTTRVAIYSYIVDENLKKIMNIRGETHLQFGKTNASLSLTNYFTHCGGGNLFRLLLITSLNSNST